MEYGVGLSAWEEGSHEQARLAAEAGFTWVRQGFPWQEMEVGKGIFEWEVADRVVEALEGLSIIALVDSPPAWAQAEGPANTPPYNYRDFGDFLDKMNRQTTWEATKWVKDNRRMGLGRALWRTSDRFMRTFLRKKAYKEGFVGFMIALFAGLYQILSYAKYREFKSEQK